MNAPITIVMPIYDGVTQLDFTGPHQLFSRLPGAKVIVASVDAQAVSADGLTFSALADLGGLEACDLLCVPGGNGCTQAIANPRYMTEIKRLAATALYITSVCSGSLILGAAGLLMGRRAACHWAFRDMLPLFGAIPDPGRVVRDGTIITGGGVTAGIDFALAVIAELAGQEMAEAVQLGLEYAPEPPFGVAPGRPETASAAVREIVIARIATTMPPRRAVIEQAARDLSSRA
ncbi:DJ-1/PfpI family protein [Rhizobium sp. L51/94]|uniref:DJ-1/PfpI family protein n=1 Tax=Rhizobium sp. L51/94 TaxID=2819999 RepID=UPI001C5BD9AC|nr:DJ-1/PfpI family protein [Rhizobium sp. L51/94]QXZ80483.1 DJ-1/PfpI family protein [Rhizobium sp. L51/94]